MTTVQTPVDAPVSRDAALQSNTRGIFRMMLSGIFIVAGINHLVMPEKIVDKLLAAPFSFVATALAPPEALITLAGIALLVGGLALLVGYRTRAAALLLIALIIPITLTVQVGRVATLGPLFKNIGLMGALFYFATHGADSWSVDAIWRRRGETKSS